MKKWGLQAAGILIGALALGVFLAYFFDWRTAREVASAANPGLALLATAGFAASVGLRALRWTYILRRIRPLPWSKGYHAAMIANFLNIAMPVRVGEIARLVVAKRFAGVDYASSTAATLIDRAIFLLIILLLLAFAPLAGFRFAGWLTRLMPLYFLFIAAGAGVFFLGRAVPDLAKRFLQRTCGLSPARVEGLFGSRFGQYALETMRLCHLPSFGGARLLLVALFALLTITADGLCLLALFRAFGAPVGFLQALMGACMMNILFIVPSPPGQVGTAEMYPVLIFSIGLGLPKGPIATAAVFWHLATLGVVAALGIHSTVALGLHFRELMGSWRADETDPAR